METDTWEEIYDWDVAEDVEFARRMTITSVNVDTGNFDLQNRSTSSSSETDIDDEEYEYVETYKRPTYANILKTSRVMDVISFRAPNKPLITNNQQHFGKSACSQTPISLDGANVNYDASELKNQGARRREQTTNARVAKQKLYKQLLTNMEIEEAFSHGDNNRNHDFMILKASQKAMKAKKRKKIKG